MGIFNFDKIKSVFKKKPDTEVIRSNLDNIKEDLIKPIVEYSSTLLENNTDPIMMEYDKQNRLRVYPNIDSVIKGLAYEVYTVKYNGMSSEARPIVDEYLEDLVANDISIQLGEIYQNIYNNWSQEYYKDSDSVEEEMWNFEIKGELKYKGFIEKAAEAGDSFSKGHINLDITPNLEHKEVNLLPYVEHDENPDEIVDPKNDESIEIIEVL